MYSLDIQYKATFVQTTATTEKRALAGTLRLEIRPPLYRSTVSVSRIMMKYIRHYYLLLAALDII